MFLLQGNIWYNFHGQYLGTVGAAETPDRIRPDGYGDFDEFKSDGFSYSGAWCGGKPRGIGWLKYPDGSVFAGEVLGDLRRRGLGVLWNPGGRMCYEGQWCSIFPQGEGTMMYEDGELWRVRFKPGACLWDSFGWDSAVKVALLGRVIAGRPAPVARRGERGAAPKWVAIVALADGRMVLRRFRGLTKVQLRMVYRLRGISHCRSIDNIF